MNIKEKCSLQKTVSDYALNLDINDVFLIIIETCQDWIWVTYVMLIICCSRHTLEFNSKEIGFNSILAT